MRSRLRRLLHWLSSPAANSAKQLSADAYHCPICDQELPLTGPGARLGWASGPIWFPPPREELIAKCPFDGRAPYNEQAQAMLADGELPVTRRA